MKNKFSFLDGFILCLLSWLAAGCAAVNTTSPAPGASTAIPAPTNEPILASPTLPPPAISPLIPTETVMASPALPLPTALLTATNQSTSLITMENTPWSLTWFFDDNLTAGLADYPVSMKFNPSDGSVSGKAACNLYYGTYQLKAETLTFTGVVITTKRPCKELQGKIETAFVDTMAQVTSYIIRDGSLILFGSDGNELLRFEPDSSK